MKTGQPAKFRTCNGIACASFAWPWQRMHGAQQQLDSCKKRCSFPLGWLSVRMWHPAVMCGAGGLTCGESPRYVFGLQVKAVPLPSAYIKDLGKWTCRQWRFGTVAFLTILTAVKWCRTASAQPSVHGFCPMCGLFQQGQVLALLRRGEMPSTLCWRSHICKAGEQSRVSVEYSTAAPRCPTFNINPNQPVDWPPPVCILDTWLCCPWLHAHLNLFETPNSALRRIARCQIPFRWDMSWFVRVILAWTSWMNGAVPRAT